MTAPCDRKGCARAALADINVTAAKEDRSEVTLYFCSLECVAAKVGLSAEEMRRFREAAQDKRLEAKAHQRSDDLPN